MSKKEELLRFIEKIGAKDRKKQKAENIAEITRELEYYKERRAAAAERAAKQEAAGDKANAKRSRKAYRYCDKYCTQLEAILDGYKAHPGKHFTKDARNRYTEARELPAKK